MDQETKNACKENATNQLLKVMEEDCWMVAMIHVKGDRVFLDETTCNFPHKEHENAKLLFEQALDRKLNSVKPKEPLPVANLVPAIQDHGVCRNEDFPPESGEEAFNEGTD